MRSSSEGLTSSFESVLNIRIREGPGSKEGVSGKTWHKRCLDLYFDFERIILC